MTTTTTVFNLKKVLGRDLPEVLDRRTRKCPQCGGVGWDDSTVRVAKCCRCSGSGIVKLAQTDPQQPDPPNNAEAGADIPSPGDPEPSATTPPVDFGDTLADDDLLGNLPSENEIPPEQLKSDIAAMLSSSFSHTVAAVFDHVSGFDTEMSSDKRAKYAGQDQQMAYYIYQRLDVMTPEQLRSTFKVFRK